MKVLSTWIDRKLGENVGIESMSITYCQCADSNSPTDAVNVLTIEAEPVAELNDNHPYYYTIKTDRWAVSDTDELAGLVEDFHKRLIVQTQKTIDK